MQPSPDPSPEEPGKLPDHGYYDSAWPDLDLSSTGGYYDEQGNLIPMVPGASMAEAFTEAGYYDDASYAEGQEGAEQQTGGDEDGSEGEERGRGGGDDDVGGGGGAGVREPRRPAPGGSAAAVEAEPGTP